jgi:hypothetical protein
MPEHKVLILFLAQLQAPAVGMVLVEGLRAAVPQLVDLVDLVVAAVVTGVLAEPLLLLDKEMLEVAVVHMALVQVAVQVGQAVQVHNLMAAMVEHHWHHLLQALV